MMRKAMCECLKGMLRMAVPIVFTSAWLFTQPVQAQYIHVDVSAGIQYFNGMSSKAGWDYNIGGRLLFNDHWYVAALIHQGINRGKYDGMYAGEMTKLDHRSEAALFGVGPGYMYKLSDDVTLMAHFIGGWGALEKTGNPEVKNISDIETYIYKGFSAAAVVGLEYQLNTYVWGVNLTSHYIDKQIMPSVNLKFGLYFVL